MHSVRRGSSCTGPKIVSSPQRLTGRGSRWWYTTKPCRQRVPGRKWWFWKVYFATQCTVSAFQFRKSQQYRFILITFIWKFIACEFMRFGWMSRFLCLLLRCLYFRCSRRLGCWGLSVWGITVSRSWLTLLVWSRN